MDTPFKKEKKKEIGADMTPGRAKVPRNIPETNLDELFKPDKGGGGGKRFIPRPETSQPESVQPVLRPNIRKADNAPSTPKTHTAKPKEEKPKQQYIYAEKRRCIAKVDYRGLQSTGKSSGTEKAESNRNTVTARLAPFMKTNDGSTNGAQVGYIKREDAIEGELFNYRGNGLQALDGEDAINQFHDKPTLTVVLSPEDAGADLYELTKRFMRDVYLPHAPAVPLFWCAAIHGNTDHKHVHIIVSAEDINGNDAKIDNKYVHSGALQRNVSDILTDIQGYRFWKEKVDTEKKKKSRLFMSSEDRQMLKVAERLVDGTRKFVLNTITGEKDKSKISNRLQTLKKLEFAYQKEGDPRGTWYLTPDGIEKLNRADYVDVFGLTEAEIGKMVLDTPYSKPYNGTIIESVVNEIPNGQKKPKMQTMYFMIKETDSEDGTAGKIHLRRELFKTEDEREGMNSLNNVTKEQIKDGLKKQFEKETEKTRGRA